MIVKITTKNVEDAYTWADRWANTAQRFAEQLEDEGTINSVKASKHWYLIMDKARELAELMEAV